MKPVYRRSIGVWLGLLALLAATCASAFVPMGAWNSVTNLAIATVKALLVAWFFMHLHEDRFVFRLVALGALFTLALLVGLSLADYTTREPHPAPWEAPEQGAAKNMRTSPADMRAMYIQKWVIADRGGAPKWV